MIEKLVTDYGNPNPNPTTSPNVPPSSNREFPPPPFVPLSSVQPPLAPPPPPRDMDYYKHLIHQHGREGQQQQQQQYSNGARARPNPEFGSTGNNPKMRDLKGKMIRPCMYFNSARGCRNGANCTFLHDSSLPQRSGNSMATAEAQQSSKRMKFDREEITGT